MSNPNPNPLTAPWKAYSPGDPRANAANWADDGVNPPRYAGMTAHQGSPASRVGLAPPRSKLELKRRKLIGAEIAAGLVFIAGLVMNGATSANAAICNSTLGTIAQGLDGTAAKNCGLITGVNTLGTAFIWIGVLFAAGAAVGLWQVYKLRQDARS
jgi:hypothetical protein